MGEGQQCSTDKMEQRIKQTWSKLSDADIALAKGQKDKFFARLKEVYGLNRDEAQRRLDEINSSCGMKSKDEAA